ncbi:Cell division protein FtsH [hydrothermal vent metagenome]|uniref:Uncharacterized AAA domain-containing protein ycf46 n=1 Tax=hydrothermal vent metagenome TaxID=652676 RepID=A0A3B1AY15_9ZZZZ
MKDSHDLSLLIRSRVPIISLQTKEERRAIELLTSVTAKLLIPLYRWSITEGLLRLEEGFSPQRHNSQPQDVLGHIKASLHPGIFILTDFHPYLDDPLHVRLLKDIAISYADAPRTVVFLSHDFFIPDELSNFSASFQLSMPSRKQIAQQVKKIADRWAEENNGRRVKADKQAYEMLLGNLTGLTLTEVKRLARGAIYDDGAISESDIPEVLKAKYELLNAGSVLQFEYETEKFSDVGGFSVVKQWLKQRKQAFIKEIPGLNPPKGMLLLGVQGCGKSLAAKAVAGIWGLPLLHLDFGALFNKYHGETERNLRKALDTAEVMAPCVLWVDEIEKALGTSDNDGGTSQRVLATLLTWLAEKIKPVFMVATANNIDALPPELIRKGRFDEIFFVDLPKHAVRMSIFKIHLKRRMLDPALFNIGDLAKHADGFSGAEIEQAIVSAFYAAHASNVEVNDELILKAISQTKPLSVVMAEPIERLRHWAKERTVSAD